MMNTPGQENQHSAPPLCANACGFYGNPTTKNLCSKCYRDLICSEQQQTPQIKQQPNSAVPCPSGNLIQTNSTDISGQLSETTEASESGIHIPDISNISGARDTLLEQLIMADTPMPDIVARSENCFQIINEKLDDTNQEHVNNGHPVLPTVHSQPTNESNNTLSQLSSISSFLLNDSAQIRNCSSSSSSAENGSQIVTLSNKNENLLLPVVLDNGEKKKNDCSISESVSSIPILTDSKNYSQQSNSVSCTALGSPSVSPMTQAIESPMSQTSPSSHTNDVEEKPIQSNKSRCFKCNKKIGLLGFQCRCEYVFCGLHRHADCHSCIFDYKTYGRQQLSKANQRVVADKLNRL